MVTLFNVTWLTHPKYIGWLEAVKGVPTSVIRRHCLKTIGFSNMRKRALESHATSINIFSVFHCFKANWYQRHLSTKKPVVKNSK